MKTESWSRWFPRFGSPVPDLTFALDAFYSVRTAMQRSEWRAGCTGGYAFHVRRGSGSIPRSNLSNFSRRKEVVAFWQDAGYDGETELSGRFARI